MKPLQSCTKHQPPLLYRSLIPSCPWCADKALIAELEEELRSLRQQNLQPPTAKKEKAGGHSPVSANLKP